MALRGGAVSRVRMPSTRWQKWGGSDRPFPVMGAELKEDRPMGSKDLGDSFDKATGMDEAPAGKRQYLKSGKFIGKNILSQKSRYRNV